MDKVHGGLETADDFARFGVPEINVAVAATDKNVQAIGRQRHAVDNNGKPGEMADHLARVNVPNAHTPINIFLYDPAGDGRGSGPFGSGGVFLQLFTDADAATRGQDPAAVRKKGATVHPG